MSNRGIHMDVLAVNSFSFNKLIPSLNELSIQVDIYETRMKDVSWERNWQANLPVYLTKDIIDFNNKIKTNKYDIIHCNGAYSGINPFFSSADYILHCRGSDANKYLQKFPYKPLLIQFIKKA